MCYRPRPWMGCKDMRMSKEQPALKEFTVREKDRNT